MDMDTAQVIVPVLLAAAGLLAVVGWASGKHRALLSVVCLALVGAAGIVAAFAEGALDDHGGRTLVVAVACLAAVAGGGLLTPQVFALVDRDSQRAATSVTSAGSVLRGGAWIGALERVAVFATLVAGWPAGLAVVLGLKGLGRYPELRNQEHTATAERFIIGTFTSVLWAAACAAIAITLID